MSKNYFSLTNITFIYFGFWASLFVAPRSAKIPMKCFYFLCSYKIAFQVQLNFSHFTNQNHWSAPFTPELWNELYQDKYEELRLWRLSCSSDHSVIVFHYFFFFFYFPYSCPRSRESIEKSFWVFEGVTLLIGLVACMVVFVRRRKLNREAAERVRKQISNSAWRQTINDSTRTSLWTRPMKGMQYSDVNFVKEKLKTVYPEILWRTQHLLVFTEWTDDDDLFIPTAEEGTIWHLFASRWASSR